MKQIVLWDDDEATQKQFATICDGRANLKILTTPNEASQLFTQPSLPVIVAVSGQLGGMARSLLHLLRQKHPSITRILLLKETAELNETIEYLHSGLATHVLHKPLNLRVTVNALAEALQMRKK